jgi:phosphatidylinositol alpha 1,6-mannosyltransferase
MASAHGFRHRPGGQQRLIIGMRVDEHQGLGHRSIVAYRPGVHIAHISDCYAPRTGGIETQVGGLVAQQRARGDRVQVITATRGTGDEAIRLTARMPFDLPVHPRTHRVVTQALVEQAVDVVHVHVGAVSPFAWEAVRAARDLGLPTVVTVHSMWGALSRSGYGLGARLLQWPTWGVVMAAVSDAAARQVHRVTRATVKITPNGIDPTQWTPQGRPDIDAPLHLVSVLRLAPRKRVDALLAMFAKVHAQRPESSLTIIGDGPLLAAARMRARALPVTFTGRLDRSQMRGVYATAHLFWQPSIRESFGIAALEARCAGVPVLARIQAGTSSFITHEVNGLLVNSDDAAVRAILWTGAEQLAGMRAHNEASKPPVTWAHVLPMVDEAYQAAQ